MNDKSIQTPLVYVVTGMSGAGRSTALQLFEDLGFEAVDNLPFTLLYRLLQKDKRDPIDTRPEAPLAIGIDIRTRHFDANVLSHMVKEVQERTGRDIKILFIDCDDETLIGRYNQTRRPHPLAPDRRVSDGVKLERAILEPLKQTSDISMDNSGLTVWQFRERLKAVVGDGWHHGLSINILSFSFAKGVPRDADVVFDVRFLKNPYYIESLRQFTGKDKAIADFISSDPAWNDFFNCLKDLLNLTIPRYQAEGKSYLTIAVGCTGGKHRSVFTAESLGNWLVSIWKARIIHRELEGIGS